jgi:hypothetical protein
VTQAWDFVNADILWQRSGPHCWGPFVTDLELTEEQIEALKESWLKHPLRNNPIAVFRLPNP